MHAAARALTVPLAVVALCSAQPALAGPPPLRAVAGASGSFLLSDGVRFAVIGTGPARSSDGVAIDTATGRRLAIPAAPCPGGAQAEPNAVGAGRLLEHCWETPAVAYAPEGTFIITSLASGATSRIAAPNMGTEFWGASRIGKRWIEIRTNGYHANEGAALFSPWTMQFDHRGEPTPRTYFDLDASQPVRPLCHPVRQPIFVPSPSELLPEVTLPRVTVDGSWVVIANDYRAEDLFTWHCGSPQPLVLSKHLLRSDQAGAGIVTWIGPGSILYAERLATRRRWHWTTPYGFQRAVHTANRMYAIENCPARCQAKGHGNRLVAASLRGL